MANQPPSKGFWASIADGFAERRKERKRKSEEFVENIFTLGAAGAILGGQLPPDIDKALGPEGKMKIAADLLAPGSLEEKRAALKREQAQMREQERKANEPVPPKEQYRREAERAAQEHFGRKAAFQAEGQRLIADFMTNRSAGLSAEEIRREIQNINDWVQRKIDEI